jgi:two-component system, NtrC family, response regulator HydG
MESAITSPLSAPTRSATTRRSGPSLRNGATCVGAETHNDNPGRDRPEIDVCPALATSAPRADKILVVEDDVRQQAALAALVRNRHYQVLTASDGPSACRLLECSPDIVLTDLRLPNGDGMRVLREARRALPGLPVVVITGHGTVADAVGAMREGALDFLTKPVDPQELLRVIDLAAERSRSRREIGRFQRQARESIGPFGMIGASAVMRSAFEHIERVASTHCTVLITGESGTGKELVARAIHERSPRKAGPFVALNCAAIPKELSESELFGHFKGAFTGASGCRVGKFAAADRGTLLLDEIGEMDPTLQAKLLRTLESHTINPVGSNEEQPVDVRIVAATHRDLRSLVDSGKFRDDLYYRLNVVRIDLPPLRQRPEDVPLLTVAFLQELACENHRSMKELSHEAMTALGRYRWPGNVRELRNVLERLVILSGKEVIDVDDLPLDLVADKQRESPSGFPPALTLLEIECAAIQECLSASNGNRRRTAQSLGISTRTLLRKIRTYELKSSPLLNPSP